MTRRDAAAELTLPVGKRDHIQGPVDAAVTLVEYGDYECPHCGRAYPIVKAIQQRMGPRLRFVYRNFPLRESHPHAQQAAEAAEAAGAQGKFWEMHDLLLARQDRLRVTDLLQYADELGLDRDQFHDQLKRHVFAGRVARDVESADLSGVSGTPTFFINGQRHYGAYDVQTLTAAVKTARIRAKIAAATTPA